MSQRHPPSQQQATRGAVAPSWSGIPALTDEHGQRYELTGPPQLVGDVMYVTVAPAGPAIAQAVPLLELHVLTFDQLPAEIAAALRPGSP